MKTSGVVSCLAVYGTTHALVDAACIALLLGGIDVREDLLLFILLYNVLAFGLQLPLGWIIDRLHQPVLAAITGVLILSISLILFVHPVAAVILAGIGNALFHVGGGTISLNLKPGKASLPGIFVAPGGIGLVVGGLVSKLYSFHPMFFVTPLIIMVILLLMVKSPQILYEIKATRPGAYLDMAILFLMFTICIRSMVALSIEFPWKSNIDLLIALTAAIALGKGLGGFLADAYGWMKIAVGGLAIAALFLLFGSQMAFAGIAGMFFFNLTMPVTLVAISNVMPGKPGFSFGLTTLAIVAGALPTFFPTKTLLAVNPVIYTLIMISAVFLYLGLKHTQKPSTITKTFPS